MKFRNCIAVILILCICFEMIGCKKSRDKATEDVTYHVKEDTLSWYDTRKTDLENLIDVEETLLDRMVLDDGRIIIVSQKFIEHKTQLELTCFSPESDSDNKIEKCIDFSEDTLVLTCKILKTLDGCILNVNCSYDKGQNFIMNLYELDISDSDIDYEIVRNYDYDLGIAFNENDDRLALDKVNNIANEYIGDYLVSLFQGKKHEYYAVITDKENSLTTILINDLIDFDIKNYFVIGTFIPKGGNLAEIVFRSNEGDFKYYDFDLEKGSLKECKIEDKFSKEVNAIFDNCYNITASTYIYDDSLYVNEDGLIKKIDFMNERIDEVFDFDNCNINPALADIAEIVQIDDDCDKFVFFVGLGSSKAVSPNNKIYYCTKAEKDDYNNKTVLKLATLSDLNYDLGEMICEFNASEENEEFIIKYDKRYIVDANVKSKADMISDLEYLSTAQDVLNRLVNDMKNGNGPDILVNAYSYEQLNEEELLVDLSSNFEAMPKEDYFCNIIDATKRDDKLYQLPLSFCIPKIAIDTSVIDNIKEMNLDAFLSLVKTLKEGQMCVESRLEWFITLIENMENEVIKEGKINIDTEEFKAIIDFLKEIPDNGYGYSSQGDNQAVYRVNLSDILMDESVYREDSKIKLYSFPTYSGATDIVNINGSIAISAFSEYKDIAWKFIKEYIESDNKGMLSQTFHINRNVFKSVNSLDISSFNRSFDSAKEIIKKGNLQIHSVDETKEITKIINFADSVTRVGHPYDFELLIAIYEGLEPYFDSRLPYDQVLANVQKSCEEILNKQVENR